MLSDALNVAIGLMFIYLLLSLICSAINELIARLLAYRARTLEQGLTTMLRDPQLVQDLYDHPLINTQYRPGWFDRFRTGKTKGKPSYLSAETFALTLIDVLESQSQGAQTQRAVNAPPADTLEAALKDIPNAHLSRVLQLLAKDVQGDYEKTKANIEQWFDDTMDRVSGWYKRKVQMILLAISFVLSAAMGVDTLTLANSLWQNSTLRTAVASAAQQDVSKLSPNGSGNLSGQIKILETDLNQLNIPVGYSTSPDDPRFVPTSFLGRLLKVLGLLLTTVALSLGAPFWFDLLDNVANLRATGPKPDPSSAAG